MGKSNKAGVVMDPNIRAEWGQNLAEFRGTMSQPDFAARLGITQSTLSRIERGHFRITDDMKWLICGRLGVPLNAIFKNPAGVPRIMTDVEATAATPALIDRRRKEHKARRVA